MKQCLYFSFSQTINEEKDAESGQHRDLPRFVNIYIYFFFSPGRCNKFRLKNIKVTSNDSKLTKKTDLLFTAADGKNLILGMMFINLPWGILRK